MNKRNEDLAKENTFLRKSLESVKTEIENTFQTTLKIKHLSEITYEDTLEIVEGTICEIKKILIAAEDLKKIFEIRHKTTIEKSKNAVERFPNMFRKTGMDSPNAEVGNFSMLNMNISADIPNTKELGINLLNKNISNENSSYTLDNENIVKTEEKSKKSIQRKKKGESTRVRIFKK